ncbi:hypothetical protein AMJ86_02395 [bacterium SM23_57]|nr:MAG: hypothetical protein AMJ86_02395 [bacterium SM23_57]
MRMHGTPMHRFWGCVFMSIVTIAGFCFGEWIEIGHAVGSEPISSTVLRSDDIRTDFTVSVHGLNSENIVINGDAYSRLSIPGEIPTWEIGKPEVPKVVKLIAIPPTGDVELHVEAGNFSIFSGINVPPAQDDDLWDVVGAGDAVVFDDACYGEDAYYPAKLAEMSEPMIARDLRVVAVTVYPVQYNPVTQQLKVYSELTISVEHTGESGANEKRVSPRRLSRAMLPFYRGEILNFDELELDDPGAGSGALLIICINNSSVLTEVNRIAEWKRKKGYNTLVVTTSVTGTSSSDIYDYIYDMYSDPNQDPPLEYVMIVGDASGTYGVAPASSSEESDYSYSLLEGNDDIAELAVGRLSFSTISELQNIRNKIIGYESNPYMGGSNPDWFEDAWMYAGISYYTTTVSSTQHTKEYVRQLLLNAGYNDVPLTTHSGDATESVIQSHLNAGVSIWNHRMAWISQISCSDLDNLNNGWMLPVCLNITCSTGNWVSSTAISECLLRGGSTIQPQGAIAAIATATIYTHTAFNNAMDASFFHAFVTLGQYHVGDALAVSKAHFLWQYEGFSGGFPGPSDFCYWNNLMGDPSLEVWTDTPSLLSANYPSTISVGTNNIIVSVEDGFSQPLEGAYVHTYKRNETFCGEVTDAIGEVILPITATTVDTLFITVTKRNYKPVLGYVVVQTAPHNVMPLTVVIDDDNSGYSQGNNNGDPNPGEALEVNVTLKNWGYQSVSGVSATISTTDPYVISIDNATVYYGNISAGGQVTPGDDFELTLSSTIPDDYSVELLVTISDNTLTTYEGMVVLDIQEVDLDYSDHSWLNSGNGVFNGGETVDLEVDLANIGHVAAPTGITGTVAVNHPLITVLDNAGTWPAITQGSTGSNSSDLFQLRADSSLFSGTPFQVTLYLENAAGFRDTAAFNEILGISAVADPIGPDAYGYYAFDNDDDFYSKYPSYDWMEIDGGQGGSGTVLSIPDYGNNQDASVLVSLPFTVQYYGQTYNSITVCSNGWLAFGDQSSLAHAQNWRIPGAIGALSQVSVLWDDFQLSSSGNGRVWKYYDSANHRFIIEWSRVYNRGSGDTETFEVIIYDENHYPTPTGDAEILMQYLTVTNDDYEDRYASVGIDNQDQSIGIEYTYNNIYPPPAATLMNGRAILFTTERGILVDPPNIEVTPSAISAQVPPGDSAEATLIISNTGMANLDYSIFVSYDLDCGAVPLTFPLPDPIRQDYIDHSFKDPLIMDIANITSYGQGQLDGSGGPDVFGYTWIDSDEPDGPLYSWVEISAVGTNTGITNDDQNAGPFSLGFSFDFYGNTYNSIRVCSNGFLSLTSTSTSWTNYAIPNSDEPNALLAPFWDDLYPPGGGDIYYYQDAANQRFIVQYDAVDHYGYTGGPYTFEVILYANGNIVYQYRSMVSLLTSATVGIENPSGTDGLQVAYNETYIHNNLAILFRLPGQWLEVDPLIGVVETSGSDTIDVFMDASELELGIYEGDITIINTDPNNSVVVVPVTFTVTNEPPAPPVPVDDLVISTLGNHITLSWSPVTEDIYGQPITVSGYSVYADPDPSFVPGPGNQIGSTSGTIFLQSNALLGHNLLFYVVTAVE